MIPLQLFVVWCFIYTGAIAKSEKREVTAPQLLRGGFAASSGPYGNEASASTLNYQGGNQGNYNNVDAGNAYSDYGNYNGPLGNIPVQEQADTPTQNVRVPVWSPPTQSQNPYILPQQQAIQNPVPQAELIQIPIQQALQTPYQPQAPIQEQQAYIPQEQPQQGYPGQIPQQGYADQFPQQGYTDQIPQQGYADQIPQQYSDIAPGVAQSYPNSFLSAPSTINDPSPYRTLPPSDSYNNGNPSQANQSPSISTAANIAASYGNTFQNYQGGPPSVSGGVNSIPSRGLPIFGAGTSPSISSGTPSRFVGKSLRGGSSPISSSINGGLHSIDEVLGGIGDFDTSSFGSSFGGSFGHGGFGLGGFGSNYFSGLGGFNGFGGFGSSPFSNGFSFGGLSGGLRGRSPKFSNIGSVSTSLPNSIPFDNKSPRGGDIASQQIQFNQPSVQNNAIPTSNAPAGPQNIPSQQNAIPQPSQEQSAKN